MQVFSARRGQPGRAAEGTAGHGTPDLTAFSAGLETCSNLASRNHAEIIIVVNGQSEGPFDLYKEDVAVQVKALEEISRRLTVHVIAYAAPVERYRKHISGYAASVYLGEISKTDKPPVTEPGT